MSARMEVNNMTARILPTRNGNMSGLMNRYQCFSMHGSYLQGMETAFLLALFLLSCDRTDPTYKEWKPEASSLNRWPILLHGSYLQGMETLIINRLRVHGSEHGSYLQGMETLLTAKHGLDDKLARILPTRNGNVAQHD